jgi:hypothetical protein
MDQFLRHAWAPYILGLLAAIVAIPVLGSAALGAIPLGVLAVAAGAVVVALVHRGIRRGNRDGRRRGLFEQRT